MQLQNKYADTYIKIRPNIPKVTITMTPSTASRSIGLLEAALRRTAAARPGLCHYLLDIRVPVQDDKVRGSRVSSLLYAAAGLLPAELRFTFPRDFKVTYMNERGTACFRRATSIELRAGDLRLYGRSWLSSLERLAFSGCRVYLAGYFMICHTFL
jgi:hypothetical protein